MRALLLILMFLPVFSFSQDRHYWYQQYGGRSSLLGGAVVGDVRDNSSVYYNPGAIGFIENNMLSISANAYDLSFYKFNNALGEEIDLDGTSGLVYPQMIGGFVPVFENKKWKWAYSLLTRNNSYFSLFSRYGDVRNAFENVQGEEQFIAGIQIQTKKQEQWGGISVGKQLNKNISIGATMFISYKSVQGNESLFYRAFPQTDAPLDSKGETIPFFASKAGESRYFDVPSLALVWKFGLAAQYESWRFGSTITLPAINLWFMKFGSSQRELELSNIEFGGEILRDYIEIGREVDRQSKQLSPLSIAFGVSKSMEKSKLYFSAEYFFKIEGSNILISSGETDITTTPGEIQSGRIPNLNVFEAYKSVFNFSVAYERNIYKSWNLLTSLRTDFNNFQESKFEEESTIEPYSSPWDLYHLTLGAERVGEKNNFSAGLQYSMGIGKTEQYQNFKYNDYSLGGILNPELGEMDYQHHGLTLIISYTYKFDD